MKQWITARPWRAAALGLLLAACTFAVASGRTPLYTPSYTPEVMSTIPVERRTHCLGRFLVDLPAGFTQLSGGWGNIELYYGLDKNFQRVYATVEPGLFTPAQFAARVQQRHAELQRTINSAAKEPMLMHVERLDEKSSAVLFRRHDDNYSDITIKSEVHQLVGQRYVRYEQESFDKISSNFMDKNFRNVDPAPVEARLKMIAGKLKPEQEGGPGFCFQGVLFDVGQDDEVATFHFRTPAVPDLALQVHYHAVTGQPKESLYQRLTGGAKRLPQVAAMISTLRKRESLLGGMPAQEVLDKTARPTVQHVFDIETRTDKQNIARPMISINMTTGSRVMKGDEEVQKPGPSSLSDDQAVQLWDEIVKSVRLRPGALPPGMTVLGAWVPLCRFGDTCPRSGYWMKQVTHPGFAFNGYHALPRVHQPFKQGDIFLPDIEDEHRYRPFTTWAWRRELG